MGTRGRRKNHVWCVQPLSPLMEGPDLDARGEKNKKESSWEVIRTWARIQMEKGATSKRMDLKLMLGVLGCPLAPIPISNQPSHCFSVKDSPIENSSASYIIHQYLAATGCLKSRKCTKSLYATGGVRMLCCETESASGRSSKTMTGAKAGGGESGCFVLWQMSPGMWLVELVMAGYKVVAGSDGRTIWRHLPWLGTHAAKGPQRPLRRIVQGLDPRITASMFTKAQCLGEKRIGDDDCFVLKVSADQSAIVERSEGSAEVIRHALFGYFSQKSGLLVYMEDSHLTRVHIPGSDSVFWETTIGSSIGDYRVVDGVLIAHQGRSVATVFRFGEALTQHSKTRMEEVWRIDDVVFDVPGLSMDCFIPPTEIIA